MHAYICIGALNACTHCICTRECLHTRMHTYMHARMHAPYVYIQAARALQTTPVLAHIYACMRPTMHACMPCMHAHVHAHKHGYIARMDLKLAPHDVQTRGHSCTHKWIHMIHALHAHIHCAPKCALCKNIRACMHTCMLIRKQLLQICNAMQALHAAHPTTPHHTKPRPCTYMNAWLHTRMRAYMHTLHASQANMRSCIHTHA